MTSMHSNPNPNLNPAHNPSPYQQPDTKLTSIRNLKHYPTSLDESKNPLKNQPH